MAEEKIEKGIISEEALEEIAGGLKAFGYDIPNDKIKKAAIGAGVTIASGAALIGGYVGKKLYDHYKESPATPAPKPTDDPGKVNYFDPYENFDPLNGVN